MYSTCFGKFQCPSSGVSQHWIHAAGTCHACSVGCLLVSKSFLKVGYLRTGLINIYWFRIYLRSFKINITGCYCSDNCNLMRDSRGLKLNLSEFIKKINTSDACSFSERSKQVLLNRVDIPVLIGWPSGSGNKKEQRTSLVCDSLQKGEEERS
jgi:hypothetical protein